MQRKARIKSVRDLNLGQRMAGKMNGVECFCECTMHGWLLKDKKKKKWFAMVNGDLYWFDKQECDVYNKKANSWIPLDVDAICAKVGNKSFILRSEGRQMEFLVDTKEYDSDEAADEAANEWVSKIKGVIEQQRTRLGADAAKLRRTGTLVWKKSKYYFVLRERYISWFKNDKAKKPLGKMSMTGVELNRNTIDSVTLSKQGEEMTLFMANPREADDWFISFDQVVQALQIREKEDAEALSKIAENVGVALTVVADGQIFPSVAMSFDTPSKVKEKVISKMERFRGALPSAVADTFFLKVDCVDIYLIPENIPMKQHPVFVLCSRTLNVPTLELVTKQSIKERGINITDLADTSHVKALIERSLGVEDQREILMGQPYSQLLANQTASSTPDSEFLPGRLHLLKYVSDVLPAIRANPRLNVRFPQYLGTEPIHSPPATVNLTCTLPKNIGVHTKDFRASDTPAVAKAYFHNRFLERIQARETEFPIEEYQLKVVGKRSYLVDEIPLIDFDYVRECINKKVRISISLTNTEDLNPPDLEMEDFLYKVTRIQAVPPDVPIPGAERLVVPPLPQVSSRVAGVDVAIKPQTSQLSAPSSPQDMSPLVERRSFDGSPNGGALLSAAPTVGRPASRSPSPGLVPARPIIVPPPSQAADGNYMGQPYAHVVSPHTPAGNRTSLPLNPARAMPVPPPNPLSTPQPARRTTTAYNFATYSSLPHPGMMSNQTERTPQPAYAGNAPFSPPQARPPSPMGHIPGLAPAGRATVIPAAGQPAPPMGHIQGLAPAGRPTVIPPPGQVAPPMGHMQGLAPAGRPTVIPPAGQVAPPMGHIQGLAPAGRATVVPPAGQVAPPMSNVPTTVPFSSPSPPVMSQPGSLHTIDQPAAVGVDGIPQIGVSTMNKKFRVYAGKLEDVNTDKVEKLIDFQKNVVDVSFSLQAVLLHGIVELCPRVTTVPIQFRYTLKSPDDMPKVSVTFGQWIVLDMLMNRLPMETVLHLEIHVTQNSGVETGTTFCFGWSNYLLFGRDKWYRNDVSLLNFWPGSAPAYLGTTSENLINHSAFKMSLALEGSAIVGITGNTEQDIFFDKVTPFELGHETPPERVKSKGKTLPHQIKIYARSLDKMRGLTPEQRATTFTRRYDFAAYPTMLPYFLLSVDWCNWEQVCEARRLLYMWAEPEPRMGLELLDWRFADRCVREYAVLVLDRMGDGELAEYLVQLVSLVKFEAFHDSALARFLIRRALQNHTIVGHPLFWLLKSEIHTSVDRLGMLLEAYLRGCDARSIRYLATENKMIKDVASAAGIIKNTIKEERVETLKYQLRKLNFPPRFQIPLFSDRELSGLILTRCKYMKSKKMPLWLVFQNSDRDVDDTYVMYKQGDDLRQDVLTLQILRLLDRTWHKDGLDLILLPYGVMCTGFEEGMVEIVRHSETFGGINRSAGGTMAVLKPDVLRDWVAQHNSSTSQFDEAVQRFALSAAGYCVATYVFGIADRHNDNIMIREDGTLFHIDFGHVLGHFKKKLGVKRERAPMIFTPQMATVLGGQGAPMYKLFQESCCRGFRSLRNNVDTFLALLNLTLCCDLPEVKSVEDVLWVRDHLRLDLTDEEADKYFLDLIEESLHTVSTQLMDMIHIMAN